VPWFKVDDSFYDHPKFLDVPNAAVGLWTKAGAWCGKHLTDGVIPATQVKRFKGTNAQVNALISAGIWIEDRSESGSKVYRFHDWNGWQPTREQKLKEREEQAERQRKSRERKAQEQEERRNVTRDSHVTPSRDSHECHKGVSQRPVPARPDPTLRKKENPTKGKKERSPQSAYADEFAEWYADYPRKRSRKQAEKAFAKARKDGVTVQELTDGLAKAKRSWQLEGRDSTKIPYPASWLNAEGWADEETTPQQTQPPSKAQQYLEIGQRLSQQAQQESDRQRQILEANRNATNPEDIIPPF